jgi:FixJ family two-component response regulator
VTGYADAALLGAALNDGALGCLPKPYSRDALALAVRSALDQANTPATRVAGVSGALLELGALLERDRPEEAVRLVVGAGREEQGVGRTGTGAVAEADTPEPVD